MLVNTEKTSRHGLLSSKHWRPQGKIKLEIHNEARVFDGVSVLVPWIKEVPFVPAPWVIQGWENVWSAQDIDLAGFVPTVNQAMGHPQTRWTLIWNSDAWPQFTQGELEDALRLLPAEVAIAAPIAEPGESAVQITGERIPGRKFMYWNVTDMGPLAISMGPGTGMDVAYADVRGTAYAPLYVVKTAYFRNIGGLSPLYGPGYFDDAHFWRLTRRMGYATVILPQLEYKHEGRKSFSAVWKPEELATLHEENLRRYLLSWGAIERQPPDDVDLEAALANAASTDPGQTASASNPLPPGLTFSSYPTTSVGEALARIRKARRTKTVDKA